MYLRNLIKLCVSICLLLLINKSVVLKRGTTLCIILFWWVVSFVLYKFTLYCRCNMVFCYWIAWNEAQTALWSVNYVCKTFVCISTCKWDMFLYIWSSTVLWSVNLVSTVCNACPLLLDYVKVLSLFQWARWYWKSSQ